MNIWMILCYIDDIFIFLKNMANHENHVRLVLEKLREVGIYAKLEGENMLKYAKKYSHTCNHNHIYGINMKKPIQFFKNFHYEAMVHSIEFIISYT